MPVLSVIKVSYFGEAVEVANGVQYGLSSSIYTRNVNLAFRAIQQLDAGIDIEQAVKLLDTAIVRGNYPEPLRLAHIFAGALTMGESRGKP